MGLHMALTLDTLQRVDGETVKLQSACRGELTLAEDCQSLTYTQEELGESTLTLTPQGAVLRRRGPSPCAMTFFPGRRTKAAYHTPFGALDLVVETAQADSRLTEEGGWVKLAYRLFQGGALASENTLTITAAPIS